MCHPCQTCDDNAEGHSIGPSHPRGKVLGVVEVGVGVDVGGLDVGVGV